MTKPKLLTLRLVSQEDDGEEFNVTVPVNDQFFSEYDSIEVALEETSKVLIQLIRDYRAAD